MANVSCMLKYFEELLERKYKDYLPMFIRSNVILINELFYDTLDDGSVCAESKKFLRLISTTDTAYMTQDRVIVLNEEFCEQFNQKEFNYVMMALLVSHTLSANFPIQHRLKAIYEMALMIVTDSLVLAYSDIEFIKPSTYGVTSMLADKFTIYALYEELLSNFSRDSVDIGKQLYTLSSVDISSILAMGLSPEEFEFVVSDLNEMKIVYRSYEYVPISTEFVELENYTFERAMKAMAGRGVVSVMAKDFITADMSQEADLDSLLRAMLDPESFLHDYTFAKRDNRFYQQDIYLPDLDDIDDDGFKRILVNIGVDTSGSIDKEMLRTVFGVVFNFIKEYHKFFKFNVLMYTTSVYRTIEDIGEMYYEGVMTEIDIKSGGTDYIDLYARSNKDEAELVLNLTDMQCHYPKMEHDFKLLYITNTVGYDVALEAKMRADLLYGYVFDYNRNNYFDTTSTRLG